MQNPPILLQITKIKYIMYKVQDSSVHYKPAKC